MLITSQTGKEKNLHGKFYVAHNNNHSQFPEAETMAQIQNNYFLVAKLKNEKANP